MERGTTEVNRMTVSIPLQRKNGSNALRFEVGVRWSLPLRSWASFFNLRPRVFILGINMDSKAGSFRLMRLFG